ncbi:hypothetical protein C8R46DRAFT_841262, partial [Mycena filopes]
MPLPKGIPTLRSFATGNLTRVDNVFCSPSLLPAYISCDTAPELMPVKTDHFPIIHVLDLAITCDDHQPRPMYRMTDWGDFRKQLLGRLQGLQRCEAYDSVAEVEQAIAQLEGAIMATVEETVEMSKPSPYSKRWFSKTLKDLKRTSMKLERCAYHQR